MDDENAWSVSARSETKNIFMNSYIEIVGSNPTRGMCVHLRLIFALPSDGLYQRFVRQYQKAESPIRRGRRTNARLLFLWKSVPVINI
jgi:hypothetical protein